jgi:hypothetical protein
MIVADCYQDYSAAADAMTRAAQAMPENAGVHASPAGYRMFAGDLDAARVAIERALLLDPNSIEAAKLARAIEQHKGPTRSHTGLPLVAFPEVEMTSLSSTPPQNSANSLPSRVRAAGAWHRKDVDLAV